MRGKYLFISLVLLTQFIFSGCNHPFYQQQFYVFGTLVDISIWGVPEFQANEAINAVAEDFQTMHQNWHAWKPSPLTDLNQTLATGKVWAVTEISLLPLLIQSKHFYHLSEGLFNPAIGQLIHLWGFHHDDLRETNPHFPPTPKQIAELVKLAPSMKDIQITDHRIWSHNQAVQLDFGAFAKGYAVDLAIEKLRQLGIHHAIINAGGNLKAMGKKGDKPWLIGIRHPSGTGILAAVTVEGEESVITSGNYERFREYKGIRYSHIIDPRTGQPTQGLSSVTIIAPSAALADAASTALTVAGLQGWYRIARKMGVKYVMIVDEAGTVYMNPDMVRRVQFLADKKPKIVVSESL